VCDDPDGILSRPRGVCSDRWWARTPTFVQVSETSGDAPGHEGQWPEFLKIEDPAGLEQQQHEAAVAARDWARE